jgi:hypothetical protein
VAEAPEHGIVQRVPPVVALAIRDILYRLPAGARGLKAVGSSVVVDVNPLPDIAAIAAERTFMRSPPGPT